MPTSPITLKRKASSGKASRWIIVLSSGKTPHAHAAQPTTHAKTERKSACGYIGYSGYILQT